MHSWIQDMTWQCLGGVTVLGLTPFSAWALLTPTQPATLAVSPVCWHRRGSAPDTPQRPGQFLRQADAHDWPS